MDEEPEHPIYDDIRRGDIETVQQRVLADAAVLDEQSSTTRPRLIPLMHAIDLSRKPAIALWLLEHRGQHHLDTANGRSFTALHYAAVRGPLEVVQALVAAGANPAALTGVGSTPLMRASYHGRTDIVAFLLRQPAVKASIDHVSQYRDTAISLASAYGHQPIVQLLLDAGADPTIPPGERSPLSQAAGPRAQWQPPLTEDHEAIAALLRHTITMADTARALHKARRLLGAGAAALACLQGRVEQRHALPQVELTGEKEDDEEDGQEEKQQQKQEQEKLRATAAFAAGVSGGERDTGLCEELYVELLGYMVPAWADKEPDAGGAGARG